MLHRPDRLSDALQLLADEDDVRPLAGGASLVAMLNAQLVEPKALVSLSRIAALRGIDELPDGSLRIGAMTRHAQVAGAPSLAGTRSVLQQAAASIANPTIRNMGTIGGSVALADPGADYPAALVALGAALEIASVTGTRRVPADDFFVDWYATALAPGELVTAVILPPAVPGVAVYSKLARVAGDYAIASAALILERGGVAHAVIGACGPAPVRLDAADDALAAGDPETAGALLAAALDPLDDGRASAGYRRRVAPRLLARAVADARAALAGAPS